MQNKYVAYYRVSTDKQGQSGLGLEAQQALFNSCVPKDAAVIAPPFIEVESGKRHKNRPQLLAAIEVCRQTGAILVIANISRLARNVAFVSALMESGIKFIAADMPTANELTIHIVAAMAEYEGKQISERTRVALQAAKARGVKLGNPNLAAAREKSRTAPKFYPLPALSVIELMKSKRLAKFSFEAVANYLNGLGIKTVRKRDWHAATVRRVLLRAERGIIGEER